MSPEVYHAIYLNTFWPLYYLVFSVVTGHCFFLVRYSISIIQEDL